MDNLEDIRRRIDQIDAQMARLFEQRMQECRKVAEYKKARGIAVTDSGREAEIIEKNAALIVDSRIREHYASFEKSVIAISKAFQGELIKK